MGLTVSMQEEKDRLHKEQKAIDTDNNQRAASLLSQAFLQAPEMKHIKELLAQGKDASLGLNQSARAFCLASLYLEQKRPYVVLLSGEESAERFAQHLSVLLGKDAVLRFPEREDLAFADQEPQAAVIGARCRALDLMSRPHSDKILVCSARSLLRYVPGKSSRFYRPIRLSQAQEISPQELIDQLLYLGYHLSETCSKAGEFSHKGDHIDLWPSSETSPARIEFFGDEIERIRSLIHSTGQTISDKDSLQVYPALELALSEQAIKRASRALYKQAQEDDRLAYDLQRLQERISFLGMDKYLPYLYPDYTLALDHISKDACLVLVEPRSLFDDASRAYEDIRAKALLTHEKIEALYAQAKDLNFAEHQRFTMVSIMRAGGAVDEDLAISRPDVAGKDSRLIARLRGLCAHKYYAVLAIPDRAARENFKLQLLDEHLSFQEILHDSRTDEESKQPEEKKLEEGIVNIIDLAIPNGFICASSKLGIISLADLNVRAASRSRRQVHDITDITFPFKPGDYVVHASHGIAYFKAIVRQEVASFERDYFLLEYADKDKLYVPFEQVDKLTRYIGPDGSSPRLTRLNTSDWTRATNKARKSAKKLAFDLVDLYTRRSSIKGYAYMRDGAEQREMEAVFPYQETPDQLSAIADIKADMESDKPMDRLLCGDVGFGKTEVALRAAFKAVQDNKQVMVLCPTTILAQQHFMTFFERFAPFDVEVDVLSRFRTASQQRKALERFAQGKVKVLVGTHRLLSNDVNPHSLGLIIIDEEQRFGVQHKEQLKTLREQVDVLTLSATPIPRTMQMALSGVRDMSLIKTPPANRTPVEVYVGEWDEDKISAALRLEMARGGQAYYVSNRVKTIEDALNRVLAAVPEARVECAHGQMSEKELERIMESFSAGEFDVLIATTIIESGIDNPRTNTLIIEDSQRLGLAQLYQLKGRVGRSRMQAYAYFMFPEGEVLTEQAMQRLLAIEELQDLGSGMDIAMRDLEIRGAGSLMGADQSGNLSSVGFDLFTHMLAEAVAQARGEGEAQSAEVNINLSVDYYLSEDYIPAADERVRAYRRLACAGSLETLDKLEKDLSERYGALEEAGLNLFNRERIKIRAQRLGISSVALVASKLVFQNIEIDSNLQAQFALKGGIYYPKSKKLTIPYKKDLDLLGQSLSILERCGGSDEEEIEERL